DPATCNVFGKVGSVAADIAHAAADTGACRVGSPDSLLVVWTLRFGQPSLQILNHHLAQCAEAPVRHNLTRFFHQRIACVGMCQAIQHSAVFNDSFKFQCFCKVQRCRLVGQHMKVCVQCCLCHGQMHVVWCNDADEIHALLGR